MYGRVLSLYKPTVVAHLDFFIYLGNTAPFSIYPCERVLLLISHSTKIRGEKVKIEWKTGILITSGSLNFFSSTRDFVLKHIFSFVFSKKIWTTFLNDFHTGSITLFNFMSKFLSLNNFLIWGPTNILSFNLASLNLIKIYLKLVF